MGISAERTVHDVCQRAKDNRKAVFDDAHAGLPGDLLEGIDDTIRSTCVHVTGMKLNSFSDEFLDILFIYLFIYLYLFIDSYNVQGREQ